MKHEAGEEKIQNTLSHIIELFRTGDVPKAISIVTFPPYENIPSNHWSMLNRLIMNRSDCSDARGFRQWLEAGRYPKNGSKAVYILGPRMVRKSKQDNMEEEEYVVSGFLPIPVFRAEDTDGEPLQYEPIKLPKLPLMEKAHEWGIDVGGITFQGEAHGFYRRQDQKIRLASPSERIFFHELSHAAHSRLAGFSACPEAKKEIIAELSAQVLAQLVGTEMESSLGNSYQYIERYSHLWGKDVVRACLKVLSEVEQVLKLILENNQKSEMEEAVKIEQDKTLVK